MVWLAVCSLGFALPVSAEADEARLSVAVAANFRPILTELLPAFETEHNVTVSLVSGASGALYAQAIHGAPFDVFLSADQARIDALVRHGIGLADTRFTYARGRLLMAARDGQFAALETILTQPHIRVVIANPRTAPYGMAAEQFLRDRFSGKLIQSGNIGATMAVLLSGAVDAAVLPTSFADRLANEFEAWPLPIDAYEPIEQGAIVLARGQNNRYAQLLLVYLQSPSVKAQLVESGYEVAP